MQHQLGIKNKHLQKIEGYENEPKKGKRNLQHLLSEILKLIIRIYARFKKNHLKFLKNKTNSNIN